MKMERTIKTILFSLLVVFGGFACSRQPAETPTPTRPAPTATATPQPTATATPRPTQTPAPTLSPQPEITLSGQSLSLDGILQLDTIVVLKPAWALIMSGDFVLATVPLTAGTHTDLAVTIDPLAAGKLLTVTLHDDAGIKGTFEPDKDLALEVDGEEVSAETPLIHQFDPPLLSVIDQTVAEDGLVIIDNVAALQDGWLVLHADADGQWGEPLGIMPVKEGEQTLSMSIPWRRATPILHAVLYTDGGRLGRFDGVEGDDAVVEVLQQALAATIHINLPPNILVFDQPVINDTIIIERIVSNGPGWVTILFETEDETPGNIIGFEFLEDGVNEQVPVEILGDLATGTLYAQLHVDDGDAGEFDFPTKDAPIRYEGEPRTFAFGTTVGNYLISVDQFIATENPTVTIPIVVGDIPLWVVIRADDEGKAGDVLAATLVQPGISRDLVFELDSETVTPILHAVLHVNNGEKDAFEFPEGNDFELQRNRKVIDSPFAVSTE